MSVFFRKLLIVLLLTSFLFGCAVNQTQKRKLQYKYNSRMMRKM
jgi:hypothetical protein